MKQAFTLIELLVVILIIGILSAVALPQYQKAVDKSRYQQAMILGKSIWQAEQIYYTENGTYAYRFDKLDIDMPKPTSTRQDNEYQEYYFYNWGHCWLTINYSACAITITSGGRAWYFSYYNSANHACWAYPKNNKRANAVCQAVTGKTVGVDEGYMKYGF